MSNGPKQKPSGNNRIHVYTIWKTEQIPFDTYEKSHT